MKERITAFISFLGAVVGVCIIIYANIEFIRLDGKAINYIIVDLYLIPLLSTILYIIWTKFGFKNENELEHIDYQNQILIKKIERQTLLKNLEK